MKPEPITIDGRTGTIVYLDDTWHPVPVEEATQAKVLFDDGEMGFYRAEPTRTDLGGAGSGNFGHEGRPGEVGGSGAGGGESKAYTHSAATHTEVHGRLSELVEHVDVSESPTCVTAASHVVEVLEEMQKQGYEMPDSVSVVRSARRSVHGVVQFAGGARHLTIDIPETLPANANLDDAAVAAFGGKEREGQPRAVKVFEDGKHVGWRTELLGDEEPYDRFTIRNMNDVVRHEMGHVQAGIRNKMLPETEEALRAARKVSLYGASDGEDEFLAESFVRLYRGETLPPDSQALYDKLRGPAIKTLSYRAKLRYLMRGFDDAAMA